MLDPRALAPGWILIARFLMSSFFYACREFSVTSWLTNLTLFALRLHYRTLHEQAVMSVSLRAHGGLEWWWLRKKLESDWLILMDPQDFRVTNMADFVGKRPRCVAVTSWGPNSFSSALSCKQKVTAWGHQIYFFIYCSINALAGGRDTHHLLVVLPTSSVFFDENLWNG